MSPLQFKLKPELINMVNAELFCRCRWAWIPSWLPSWCPTSQILLQTAEDNMLRCKEHPCYFSFPHTVWLITDSSFLLYTIFLSQSSQCDSTEGTLPHNLACCPQAQYPWLAQKDTKHTVSDRNEYNPRISRNISLYFFMGQHWRYCTLIQCKVMSVQLV